MTQRQSYYTLVIAAVVALAILASATVLVALHDLDPTAYATLVGSALTATGLAGSQLGQKAINGGPTIDLERLSKINPEAATALATTTTAPPVSPGVPNEGAH